jgi:hypothetical protein
MATAGIVYAVLTLTYARSYLEMEVPTALLGYWSYNSPMQEVLRSALTLLAPAAMLLGVGYLTRQQGAQIPALAQALAVAGAASCAAALIQAKPWAYHFSPASCSLISRQSSSSLRKILALTDLRCGVSLSRSSWSWLLCQPPSKRRGPLKAPRAG